MLAGLLNSLGFRQLAEDRLGQFVPATATHRPGKMISDLVMMLAAGGEHVTDTDPLRVAPGIFGQVASEATFSRFFTRLADHPGAFDYAFAITRREVRSWRWDAAGQRSPAVRASAPTRSLWILMLRWCMCTLIRKAPKEPISAGTGSRR